MKRKHLVCTRYPQIVNDEPRQRRSKLLEMLEIMTVDLWWLNTTIESYHCWMVGIGQRKNLEPIHVLAF